MQLVSGGGKCGPRAWMGRFACKAFGVPTWGCRQPGHAAMARWTPSGWMTAWGCGFDKSWWEDKRGPEFLCETKIRNALGDEVFFRQVELLEWFGKVLGEKKDSFVNPNSVWGSLMQLQLKRLPLIKTEPEQSKNAAQYEVLSRVTELQQQRAQQFEAISVENGCIIVPAAARSSAKRADFMRSYLGGMQVYLKKAEWQLEYKLPVDLVPERKTFLLAFRVCTVHEDDPDPLLVQVKSSNGSLGEYPVLLPYTMGSWQETQAVKVELGGGMEVLKLVRRHACWSFTLRL